MGQRHHPACSVEHAALQKWWERWPEWTIAEVFLPAPQRLIAVAWFSVLMEWEDLLDQRRERNIVSARLRWWQDELAQWSEQHTSHPLAPLLAAIDAPWKQLAHGLSDLEAIHTVPPSFALARMAIARLLDAIVAIEMRLFPGECPCDPDALLLHWLAARCGGGEEGIPEGMSMDGWRLALLHAWPERPPGGRARRLLSALARKRFASTVQPGHSLTSVTGRIHLLWRCWRVATQGT